MKDSIQKSILELLQEKAYILPISYSYIEEYTNTKQNSAFPIPNVTSDLELVDSFYKHISRIIEIE